MHQLNNYNIYIFDCDGVILDSNQLKIDAMKNVLELHSFEQQKIIKCLDYFKHNFGKSRFHHVDYFFENIFNLNSKQERTFKQRILLEFSEQCRKLYLTAELTPGFLSFLQGCKGKRYVASGSEQGELRDVFYQRGLDIYFDDVYGSPIEKSTLIKNILEKENSTNAIMFGDSESDMKAAKDNNIDFIFYAPFSNVKSKMLELSILHGFLILNGW